MRIDSNGIPMTTNEAGYDGGDGLANYCRWKLAEWCLRPSSVPELMALKNMEVKDAEGNPTGLMVRHPGNGIAPDGTIIENRPKFWSDPTRTSRDQMISLMYLVALRDKVAPNAKEVLDRVYEQYKKRAFLKAQNVDVMLPLMFADNPVTCFLRDLEIAFNTFVSVGLIPHVKYDKPWGFGKGKKFFFVWQDDTESDGDTNLVVNFAGSALVRRTWLLSGLIKLYKKVRGGKYVQYYYRAESGNNPYIGELYAKLIDREFR